MNQIQLDLTGDPSFWPAKVDHIASELNLVVTLRGTLKSYPGSIHWHLKQGKAKGVLEITLWQDRAWLSVQEGRKGDWIEDAIKKFLELG